MKIRIYPKSLLEAVWLQDKLLFTPEAEQPPLCLRCGQSLNHRLMVNALSRYADVHICEACGMDEALRDANHCPLPLEEWAAVKNGLTENLPDCEEALLTTVCSFENLFQQGPRPASEPTPALTTTGGNGGPPGTSAKRRNPFWRSPVRSTPSRMHCLNCRSFKIWTP